MKDRLIVFDIDGTLMDTELKYYDCLKTVLGRYGPPDVLDKTIKETFGMPGTETMRRLGIQESQFPQLTKDIASYIEHSTTRIEFFPGAREALTKLKSCYMLAVATSRDRTELEVEPGLPANLSLMDYISTTDEDVPPKPAPDVLLKVLRHLNIPPQKAVYVGDTAADMECSKAAGVPFILAGWNRQALRNVLPDDNTHICGSYLDLLEYMNGKS